MYLFNVQVLNFIYGKDSATKLIYFLTFSFLPSLHNLKINQKPPKTCPLFYLKVNGCTF